MELFIETLTGTAFELRVSPFETVMSVKAKIQRLEGIPISHQHLIWQSIELEDDYCLHDYNIHSGATLKLVLAMRGGPINTRRIPVEDSTLREMAEYMEANREEFLDKLPGNSNVTLLVFRDGDKLNFFRVVDPRPEGSLTPLSESMYPVYNVPDDDEEEDEEDAPSKEKTEENSKMKEKMDQLRVNMEKISLTKKRKYKTPSPGHAPHSSVARMRLRGLPSSSRSPSAKTSSHALNKNMCLPPVGHTFVSPPILDEGDTYVRGGGGAASATTATATYSVAGLDHLAQAAAATDAESSLLAMSAATMLPSPNTTSEAILEQSKEAKLKEGRKSADAAGAEGGGAGPESGGGGNPSPSSLVPHPPQQPPPPAATTHFSSSANLRRDLRRLSGLSETPHNYTAASARRREAISMLETLQETASGGKPAATQISFGKYGVAGEEEESGPSNKPPGTTSAAGKRKVVAAAAGAGEHWDSPGSASNGATAEPFKRSPMSSRKDFVLDTFLRPGTTARRKEFTLEGLTSSEARTVSGILRQASIEKIGSSHISSIVSSASKSRLGNYLQEGGRISSPESRLVSARLQRVSATGERHRISPTHRLPPVKAKKKQKRCFLCAKKTGLATSYQCRCGNNFCATHRYAESHDCTFDYKTEGRKLLEQSNPLVSAPKLPKI